MNERGLDALFGEVARPQHRRTHLLLVDDHPLIRQGLAAILQADPKMDVTTLGASTGRAAIETALRLRPDIIIMDVNMAEVDGIEATRAILRDLPQTKIIGLSMDPAYDQPMRQAGAVDFLVKSQPVSDVIDAIRRWSQKVQSERAG